MKDSVPVSLVPWAPLDLQDFPGGRGVRETWGSLAGLEQKVTQDLLVLKDLQGYQESLVPLDHPATKGRRVMWSYQELKGTKEKEVLMGPQDFQGSQDHMVWMDVLEKKGIQDSQGIMKMRFQVVKDFLDLWVPQAKQDLWGPRDWDFLVHQESEATQEFQATQV